MIVKKQPNKLILDFTYNRSFDAKLLDLEKNFVKKGKSKFYKKSKGKRSKPPTGIYYTVKTGYSKRYARKLEKAGIEANSYNYFSVVSDLDQFTPARVRNEIESLMQEYESNPGEVLENFSMGSGENSQDQRIVSVTVNFVY